MRSEVTCKAFLHVQHKNKYTNKICTGKTDLGHRGPKQRIFVTSSSSSD